MVKRKNRLRIIAAAAAVALAGIAGAESASATTGGSVVNAVQPSNYRIWISPNNPYSSPIYTLQPYQDSKNTIANVQCFKPELTSHSQYGGVYYGGVVRCMSGNNIRLYLYSGAA